MIILLNQSIELNPKFYIINLIILLLLIDNLSANAQNNVWTSNSIPFVEEVSWSPSGDKIASVGWSEYISIWDGQSGDSLTKLYGHTFPLITSVQWSHNSNRIASGGLKEVLIWDANTEKLMKRIPIGKTWIFSIKWNPTDSLLAYLSSGAIYIMDTYSNNVIDTFYLYSPNSGGVKAGVCWINNKLVMAGYLYGEYKVYNIESHSVIYSGNLPMGNYGIYDMSLSPDSTTISMTSYQNVYFVDAKTYQLKEYFKVSQDYLWSSSWSPNGRYLVTSGNWSQVKIYDYSTKNIMEVIPFPLDTVQTTNRSLAWSSNGDKIAIGSQLKNNIGSVSVWSVRQDITGVSDIGNIQTPTTFSLSQNYPNPFNPVTVINYSISEASFVSLKIFDIQGSEINTLVFQVMQTGNHSIEFNAKNLTSGVYFYQLKTNKYVETRKMLLLK